MTPGTDLELFAQEAWANGLPQALLGVRLTVNLPASCLVGGSDPELTGAELCGRKPLFYLGLEITLGGFLWPAQPVQFSG